MKAYFKLIQPSIFLIYPYKESSKFQGLGIYKRHSFTNAIIDFCDIYDYNNLYMFIMNSGAHKDIIEVFNERNPIQDKKMFIDIDDEVTDILVKFNIIELVKQYKESIDNKITEWENRIQKTKKI